MKRDKVKDLKVALVHDFMTIDGGAEQVLRVFHEMWPSAPVYTVTYFPDSFDPPLKGWDIRTSFVARLPFRKALEHQYKLFYQVAVEQFSLQDYDLVISATFAGYAKGVIVSPESKHICYVHNVPRYLWGLPTATHGRLGFIYKKVILPPLEHWWRMWDRQTADRPDHLVANSKNVSERVNKFYRRDASVIYPPVNIDEFLEGRKDKEDSFVYFGRLEQYKNVDMAIRACAKAGAKLKIIGSGGYRAELEKIVRKLGVSDDISFLGRLPDAERNTVVAGAKAFVFPCPDEDFGIVVVESMAAGTPVIAFASGGVMETVLDGQTGILVKDFSVEALTDAVLNFDEGKFDIETCRNQAKLFSKDSFKKNVISFIAEVL